MKRIATLSIVCCLGLLFAASTCFAQMYTVTDLGTLGGSSAQARAINASGQVVGMSYITGDNAFHAFRTAPNSPINPATDDLGTLGETNSWANGINASGQVVGASSNLGYNPYRAFRTAPNSPINPATDDVGTLGGTATEAWGINASGQVVGLSFTDKYDSLHLGPYHAFRTAPNSPINPATDDLGTFGSSISFAYGVNDSGQVIGDSWSGSSNTAFHGFRTAPNSPINPATDDLGTFKVCTGICDGSTATGINNSGMVVGFASTTSYYHAFRTAPNSPINPATDDLGTLGGVASLAFNIDNFGQVIGASTTSDEVAHVFLYSGGVMHNLENLIAAGSGCTIVGTVHQTPGLGINDRGQIAANANCTGQSHAVLLQPIYKAFVQQPINADGSSVFSATRGVLPVKFTLTQYDLPTCALLPATIAITRTAGGTLASVDESIYTAQADSGSNFRVDGCQYVYNLAASSLGSGTYRVDISINGIFVGHAALALK